VMAFSTTLFGRMGEFLCRTELMAANHTGKNQDVASCLTIFVEKMGKISPSRRLATNFSQGLVTLWGTYQSL
jgi:hypothetical protein